MWKQLAISLGLKEDATQDEILAALSKRDAQQRTQLETFTAAAAKRNLKLENDALVDAAPVVLDFTVKPTDDPATKALKERLAAAEAEATESRKSKAEAVKKGQLDRITEVKAVVAQLSKNGQVPPTVMQDVEELLSCEGAVQRLTLSADGAPSLAAIQDVGAKFKRVLSSLQSIVGPLLSQHKPGDQASPKAEAEKKADEVLASMGVKVPGKEGAAK